MTITWNRYIGNVFWLISRIDRFTKERRPTIACIGTAERNGADAYVEKPVDPEKLLRIVAEKMEEKERRTSSLAI